MRQYRMAERNVFKFVFFLPPGPLHSQDPNRWVIYQIAHLNTMALWETKGAHQEYVLPYCDHHERPLAP